MDKIKEWTKDLETYDREPLFIKKLRSSGFDNAQIEAILTAIDETCNFCWDSERPCHCWNDE